MVPDDLTRYYAGLIAYVAGLPKFNHRISMSLQKLGKFSTVHLTELSCDIFDEIHRRHDAPNSGHLPARSDIHQKRNNARYQFGDLSVQRFGDMCRDVVAELERRYPELKDETPAIPPLHRTRTLRKPVEPVPTKQTEVVPTKSTMVMEESDSEREYESWDKQADVFAVDSPVVPESAYSLTFKDSPILRDSQHGSDRSSHGTRDSKHSSQQSKHSKASHGSIHDWSFDKHSLEDTSNLSALERRLAASSTLGLTANNDFHFGVEEQLIGSRSSRLPPGAPVTLDPKSPLNRSSSPPARLQAPLPDVPSGDAVEPTASSATLRASAASAASGLGITGSRPETSSTIETPRLAVANSTPRASSSIPSSPRSYVSGEVTPRDSIHSSPGLVEYSSHLEDRVRELEQLNGEVCKENEQLHNMLADTENERKQLEVRVSETPGPDEDLREELRTLQAEYARIVGQGQALGAERGLQERHAVLEDEHDELRERHAVLEDEHGALKEQHSALQGEYSALKDEHCELKEQHGQLREAHGALDVEYGELKEAHDGLRKSHSALTSQHTLLQELHNSLQESHNSLQESHNSLQQSHNALQESHNALQDNSQSQSTGHTDAEHKALVAEHNALRETHMSLVDQHSALQARESPDGPAQARLTALHSQHTSLQAQHSLLQEDHHSLRDEYATLQGAYHHLQTQYATVQNEQMEPKGLNIKMDDYDSLVAQHKTLLAELEDQRSVTEQVRQEAQRMLGEMRAMAKNSLPFAELQRQLAQAKAEAQHWRAVSANQPEPRARASAASPGPGPSPSQSIVYDPQGLVENRDVVKFQDSIEELLETRSLESLHAVVGTVEGILGCIPAESTAFAKPTRLVMRTANQLISATRNSAEQGEFFHRSIVTAACSDLSYAMCEFLRDAKVRGSTREGEREVSVGTHESTREGVRGSARESARESVQESTQSAHESTQSAHESTQSAHESTQSAHESTQSALPVSARSDVSGPASTRSVSQGSSLGPSSPRRVSASPVSHRVSSSLVSHKVSSSPVSHRTSVHSASGVPAPAPTLRAAPSLSPKPESPVSPMTPKRVSLGSPVRASPVRASPVRASPVRASPVGLAQSPRAPAPVHTALSPSAPSPSGPSPIGPSPSAPSPSAPSPAASPSPSRLSIPPVSIPVDSTVAELQAYLEEQTSETVDSIRELLSGIKADLQVAKLRPLVDSIVYYVDLMVSTTGACMDRTEHWLLKDKGSFILQNLDDCCRRMAALRGNLDEFEDADAAPRPLKQRLAGVSFDMAKCTKELVKTVEDVSLKSEIETIDQTLRSRAR